MQRRTTHGLYAELLPSWLEGRSREIATEIVDALPLPPSAADMLVVGLLARALVRIEHAGRWLDGREDVGRITKVYDLERRLRQEAAEHGERLGLSPRSRVALGIDLVRARNVLAEVMAEDGERS
jgi:hypothetical protein